MAPGVRSDEGGASARFQPACSLVIRALNEERHLGRLLDAVGGQTVPPAEIVVVDSGSTDSTRALASKFRTRIVDIRPEEFSFGRSLNAGIAAAGSPLIAIASAHVYPASADWLERLLAPFADESVALTYGGQRGDDRTRFSEKQVFRQWFPERSAPDQSHPFCNNANAAIRRSVWAQLPYDESLTGLEDVDWARRAQRLGMKLAYVADARVFHIHEESPKKIFRRYQREAIALRRIDPDSHFGYRDFVRLFSRSVAHDIRAAHAERSIARLLPGILIFRFLQFSGTLLGFRQRGPLTSALKQHFYYPEGARSDRLPDAPEPQSDNHGPRKH